MSPGSGSAEVDALIEEFEAKFPATGPYRPDHLLLGTIGFLRLQLFALAQEVKASGDPDLIDILRAAFRVIDQLVEGGHLYMGWSREKS